MIVGTVALIAALFATPATLNGRIAAAKAGDTIVLAPGAYGWPDIFDRKWATPVTINARQATFDRLRIRRTSGVTIIGGRFSGAVPNKGSAVEVSASEGVTLRDLTVSTAYRGIVIGGSSDIRVERPTLTGLISDGINIVSSHRVTIAGGGCSSFKPEPGDHPDCVQGWSVPGQKPSSDITITGMTISGKMQGIFFGDEAKGGVDRLKVAGNVVASGYVNGIALFGCRECVVEDNQVSTERGSPNRSILRLKGGSVTTARNRND